MRNFFVLILFIIISSTSAYAKYQDKGASGAISFLYEDESYERDSIELEEQKTTQEYELNYDGNIYNPNLLTYRLSSLIRFDDIELEGSTNNGKTKEESEDFGIDASFIKSSNYPFRVYYRTSNRPRTSINSGEIINLDSKKDTYGVSGIVKFDKISIDYDASETSNIDNKEDKLLDKSILKYGTSINYKSKVDSIILKYLHITTDTQEYESGTKNNTSVDDDSLDLSYTSILSKAFSISSALGYTTSSVNDSSVINSNLSLNWRPGSKYYGNVDMAFSRSDFNILPDFNSTKTILNRVDTYDFNELFSYSMTENLIFTQSMNYFSYEGLANSGDTSSLSLGVSYNASKELTPQRRISYGSSIRTTLRQLNNVTDVNSTVVKTSENSNSTTFGLRSNLTESLPSINSRLNVNLGYSGTRSSEEPVDRYDAGFSFISSLGSFRNILDARYSSSSQTTTTNYSDNIYYTTRVGIKGSFNSTVGFEVKNVSGDTLSTKSEILKADFNFRYRFFRRLNFSTDSKFSKDLGYNTLYYSSKTELLSKLGLTTISLSYHYDYSQSDANANKTESVRQSLLAKFKRRF